MNEAIAKLISKVTAPVQILSWIFVFWWLVKFVITMVNIVISLRVPMAA